MTFLGNDLQRRLGEPSDGSPAPPAFIIDLNAGAILAANAPGWDAWGGTPAASKPAAPIDRAMPAMHSLAGATGSSRREVLTFWAARGLLQLDCHIDAVGNRAGVFLVRGVSARPDADARALPPAARLAHEVKTPLSAVIAFAEVLKDAHFGPLGNARYRDYARNIYDSARHALSVVDGLLAGDGDGLPELAFRDLEPASVIASCLTVAGPLAERAGLELVADVGPGTPLVVADEVSLKQMLLNLITNAIKFARPGDRVTVAASYDADGRLRIHVADTGPGMRPNPAVPAPAAGRTSRHDAGLGIGLPLTRALAEANGAALTVDSVPGHGTCATIAFGKDRVVPI